MMNKLELGQFWLMKLAQVLPNSSNRTRTKLAWHLAALSVRCDEEFMKLADAQLLHFRGGSVKFLDMRDQYISRKSQHQLALNAPASRTRQWPLAHKKVEGIVVSGDASLDPQLRDPAP